eukprot:jgi/Galph1/5996/GphlegSOOS_G4595.1
MVSKEEQQSFVVPTELKFRNYFPKDEQLRNACRKFVDPDEIVSKVAKDQEKIAQDEIAAFQRKKRENVSLLIPVVANLDLKRKLGKKLETLEKQTQDAILSIVREKLMQEQQNGWGSAGTGVGQQSGVALWKAVESVRSVEGEGIQEDSE